MSNYFIVRGVGLGPESVSRTIFGSLSSARGASTNKLKAGARMVFIYQVEFEPTYIKLIESHFQGEPK